MDSRFPQECIVHEYAKTSNWMEKKSSKEHISGYGVN